ncbi:hypothetical protein NFI95_14220 [Acetobacteraceae bacterium KSS8]|uniref:Sulfotransferase family protein n=1 Tax=Endosaccharibacter trunci TaxID=2812733 RepID=A0ABT1W9M9_9PROT|nr:hypothetical protein [Acetobacteraceae bacterium KSS8]
MIALEWRLPMPGLRTLIRGAEPIRHIQVYGMRCSGTHAIIKLIEANLGRDAFTESYGFKHWSVPPQILFRPDVLVLVIARDPAIWLRSLHKQPWHVHESLRALSFAEFIRTPWHSVWDDQFWGVDETHPMFGTEMMHERDLDTGERFPDPVTMRTRTLAHWAGLHRRAHNLALLDYESVRTRPQAVIEALCDATGLAGTPGGFVPLDTYKGHGIKPFVPAAYPALSEEDRDHVAARLDPAVEALFGMAEARVSA